MTRVLVTGAAGFIGRHVVERLLRDGAEVVALDSFVRGTPEHLGPDVRLFDGDIRDPGVVAAAASGADAIVHLAAMHFIPWCVANPAETLEVNVVGLQRVLDAASGSARFVLASTADVYAPSPKPHQEGDVLGPGNVYGTSKLGGEWLLQRWAGATGASVAAPRLFNVYGSGETNPHLVPEIMAALHRSDVLSLGNLEPRRDYVDVRDVAEVLARLALDHGVTGVVNVGTGVSWSARDVVEHLGRITGRALHIEQDASRMRRSDRVELLADTTRCTAAFPDVRFRPVEEGLRHLLETEGLLG